MKAKSLLCAVCLGAVLMTGCGGKQAQMDFIGNEEAKRLALADAGLSAAQVQFTASELANRSGVDYYQVDFTAGGESYKYDIDAITGSVIDSKVPEGGNHTDTADGTSTAKGQKKSGVSNTVSGQSGAGSGNGQQDDAASGLTPEQAKKKALEHAGLDAGQVTFVKSELDYEHGRQVYEVEFYATDGKEYDYEIDASTGEVISFDYDAEGYRPQNGENSKMLTEQKAKELALGQVPGAAESDIYGFKADHDDGRTVYEGKIVYNGMEYEFEIDAFSGAIRGWEAEPLD